MFYPPTLNPGDTIGLIAPCSAVTAGRAKECKKVLEQMGYRVKMADNLSADHGGFMAGSGEIRGRWITAMFADPEVHAIFCIRGGYGGSRALPYVDMDVVRNNPKIFLGYSDVTSLHNAIANQCNFVTFHGPMVSSNMIERFDDATKASLFQALNAQEAYTFDNGAPLEILHPGKATGRLTGGNLAILTASIGTDFEIDTKGKLFFIEELNEDVCAMDRMVFQLKNANKFQECAGVLLGQFSNCSNKDLPPYDVLALFQDALAGYDIPIMAQVQCGHGDPNLTLPLGAMCTMDTEKGEISFEKPVRT